MRVAVFIIGGLIAIIQLLSGKNFRRNLLFLLGFYIVISVGWVFYHYTGFLLVDFPILILLITGLFSKPRLRFAIPKVGKPLILLFLWMSFTSFFAINSGWAFAEISKFFRAYLVFICVVNFARERSHLNALLYGLFFALVFESLVAMWQLRFGYAGLWALGENHDPWRASGTFYVPHYLSNFIIFLLPLIIRMLVFQRSSRPIWGYVYTFMAASGAVALLATYTRGPWLAFIISTAIMFLVSMLKNKWRPKVQWATIVVVIIGAIFIIRYSTAITNQFGEDRNTSRDIRFDQFRVAYRVILGNPIMGTGLENYELVSPNYVTPEERLDPRSWQFDEMVHNSYLYFLAQAGVISSLLLLWAIFQFFSAGFQVIKSQSTYISNLGIGILTGFLAIFLTLLSAPDIRSEQLLIQAGVMAGLLFALYIIDQQHRREMQNLNRNRSDVNHVEIQSERHS
ncbi:O-antigen ligase family protein [candidate division KSB1 bacterium]|nr:O-antigen ligase family protein [candidate division KSB1 bacterium]